MASEVLTQQTMGRGLRLPFGKYTNVRQIDQLDIIAHQSFEELLRAENILVQFGLEDAVEKYSPQVMAAALQRAFQAGNTVHRQGGDCAPGVPVTSEEDPASFWAPQSNWQEEPGGQTPLGNLEIKWPTGEKNPENWPAEIMVRIYEDQPLFQPALDEQLGTEEIKRTKGKENISYFFPATSVSVQEPKMLLTKIEKPQIEAAARRVTSTKDVMVRQEIIASLGKKITVRNTELAEIESQTVEPQDVHEVLMKLVMNNQMVVSDQENVQLAKTYLVPTFMGYVTENWTVKSLDSAESELRALVRDFANEILRRREEVTTIYPRRLPRNRACMLPLGETIHQQITDRRAFRRGRFYGEWMKSLYQAESFDSYTGEYALAQLLDLSPNVDWWHRLHLSDGAMIYYNPKDRYFPDFVAYAEGVYWIIEGKSQLGVEDGRVQAKRKAAEEIVHRLVLKEEFQGQKWGYMIAYEQDIAKSDSFNDLLAKANPITNIIPGA